MSNTVIDIRNVSFNYGSVPVLENISLQIYKDEFIGIIGPNASGKSTLLKLIVGLLEPDTGKIEKYNHTDKCSSNFIGYVPQQITFSRNFPITVNEMVMLGHVSSGSRLYSFSKDEVLLAEETMQMLEIDDIGTRQIGALSGGQLQRVLIARTLICEPEILILDEPTSNVDMRVEENIFALLKKYSEHMTVIIVSHDISFISSYVSRVACLNRTLVCHDIKSISGKTIKDLYGTSVEMIHHH